MWKTVLPDYNSSWEPWELRSLKRQLANLNCKCKSCDRTMELLVRRNEEQKDREIQAVVSKGYLDCFVQATHQPEETRNPGRFFDHIRDNISSHQTLQSSKPSYFDHIHDNFSCPTCYVTLNLLRAGITRVFKDEEIETKAEMFACDKSTEKIVNSLEKTTSLTVRPVLKTSNYSFNEYFSDKTSPVTCQSPKKNIHREVSFLLDKYEETSEDAEEPEHTEDQGVQEQSSFDALVGNCICLDDYIDSIRPKCINY